MKNRNPFPCGMTYAADVRRDDLEALRHERDVSDADREAAWRAVRAGRAPVEVAVEADTRFFRLAELVAAARDAEEVTP